MNILKKYPIYRKSILNNFISALGDSMYYIALMTYASQMERPDLGIMLVTLSESIPHLFSIITGSIADMSQHRVKKIIQSGFVRGGIYVLVGILIGFKPSLNILAAIALLNFISDIIGKYTNGLWSPFIPYLVDRQDIEEAQGLNGGLAQIVSLFAQFFGAYLLGIFSYRVLAFINSGAFFLTMFIVLTMYTELKKIEETKLQKQAQTISVKTTWKQIRLSMKELIQHRHLFILLMLFGLANGLLTVLSPMFSLWFAENKEMLIRDFAFSIALVNGTISVGAMLGAFLGIKIYKRVELLDMCRLIFVIMGILSIAVYVKMSVLIFISIFFVGLLVGGASPKLSAAVINEIPVEQLGAVNGAINMVLMCIPPITTTLFTSIASIFSLSTALLCLIGCVFVFLLISFRIKTVHQTASLK